MTAKNKITKIVIENIKKLIYDQLPEMIDDAISEHIYEMVDEEVNQNYTERLNKKLEDISKVHAIPLDLLLRDLTDTNNDHICKGVRMAKDGINRRCAFRALEGGYCKFHRAQGEKIKKRELSSKNTHTHGPEQMFVKGCPGCENKNELIDLCPFIQ
jgi:predicted house-cleaning noncanonical NTP pyrophosphatase (MazG superfamily)